MSAGAHALAERTCHSEMSQQKPQIEKCDRGMWMTSCTGSVHGGFLGFEKKRVSGVLASEEDGWLSELAEALRRVPHMVWGRWKSQHRKIVPLSPYVEKPFNSKVIKSFVPELRSRKCFFCVFRDSYVIYIWVMNILCTFHIFMYDYVT